MHRLRHASRVHADLTPDLSTWYRPDAGYDLLKKKSDALTVRLRGMLKDIKTVSTSTPSRNSNRPMFEGGEWAIGACPSATRLAANALPTILSCVQTKELVSREMQGATFSISEAVWAAGDFKKKVVDAPQRERSLVRVRVRKDNVAGVKLPVFELFRLPGSDTELETLGLAGGGRQINKAKDKFTQLLEGLVKLGSLQTSFLTLDEAIKVTNRRVNALDNVSTACSECQAMSSG